MLRTIWIWTRRAIKWFFILLIAYLAAATLLSLVPVGGKDHACSAKETFYVTSNGIHLSFVLPNEHLSQGLADIFDVQKKFTSIGWGDSAFYMRTPEWADLTFTTALTSTLLPTNTAVHTRPYGHIQSGWVPVKVCPVQMDALTDFIEETIQRTTAMHSPMYGPGDRFYAAKGSYWLLNTCNVWVGDGLKAAGIKTALWSPFDKGILYHLP